MAITETAPRKPQDTTQPITTGRDELAAPTPGKALVLAALASGLQQMRPQFRLQLPSHIPVERFERIVITAVNNKPELVACDRRSFFNACTKAAQDGLLPDGREGALVPFKDKSGRLMVQWMPMVFGLKKLMRQSGEIDTIDAKIVFAKELEVDPETGERRFEYFISEGREHLNHKPMLWGDRGEKVLVYAYTRWKTGHVEYHPMHRDDVLKRKRASRAQKGPWQDWEDEMWLKTAIRGIAKKMPLSPNLQRAIDRDEDAPEFERLKQDAIQSIEAAAAQMGAPQIEHDPDTGEILDQQAEDAGAAVLADEAAQEAEGETALERGLRLLATCETPEAIRDLSDTITEDLTELGVDRGAWIQAVTQAALARTPAAQSAAREKALRNDPKKGPL